MKINSLDTLRLRLIPIEHLYVQAIFDNFNNTVTTYMSPDPAKNIDETKNIVADFIKQRKQNTDYVYAITLKENGEFIGLVGLHQLKSITPELGIWTKLSVHGNHYGREAIGGIIDFAKSLKKYSTLLYPVDKRNIASKKIPLFYGGKCIATKTETTNSGKILQLEYFDIKI